MVDDRLDSCVGSSILLTDGGGAGGRERAKHGTLWALSMSFPLGRLGRYVMMVA